MLIWTARQHLNSRTKQLCLSHAHYSRSVGRALLSIRVRIEESKTSLHRAIEADSLKLLIGVQLLRIGLSVGSRSTYLARPSTAILTSKGASDDLRQWGSGSLGFRLGRFRILVNSWASSLALCVLLTIAYCCQDAVSTPPRQFQVLL